MTQLLIKSVFIIATINNFFHLFFDFLLKIYIDNYYAV